MWRRLLPAPALLGLALATAACISSSRPPNAPPAASPGPTLAALAAVRVRVPAQVIVSAAQAGGGPGTGRDHVAITQAAEEQLNQAYALIRYREWGWVDEATRTYGGLKVVLLLLTKEEGAGLAFADFAGGLDRPCPASLMLDECAEGATRLAGRLGPYAFTLAGPGDLERLAALQAANLRAP